MAAGETGQAWRVGEERSGDRPAQVSSLPPCGRWIGRARRTGAPKQNVPVPAPSLSWAIWERPVAFLEVLSSSVRGREKFQGRGRNAWCRVARAYW